MAQWPSAGASAGERSAEYRDGAEQRLFHEEKRAFYILFVDRGESFIQRDACIEAIVRF